MKPGNTACDNSIFCRSVSSLRNQMEKEKHNHRQEYLRKMKENKFLLEQIEDLKKELKKAKEYRVPPHLSQSGNQQQLRHRSNIGSRKNSLIDR